MKIAKTFKALSLGVVFTFGSFIAVSAIDKTVQNAGFDAFGFGEVQAQATDKTQKRKTPALSEKMFKKLGKVDELASPPEDSGLKPDVPKALKELAKVEKDCESCNRYELAQVYFRYAYIYATTEDYANSLKYYDKVVAQSPDIPLGLETQSLKYMAQLAMQLEQYKRSLGYLDKWIELSTNVPPDIYDLKARACYQMDDKKCALVNSNKTISMREADGGVAKEVEYNLQRALYIEKEDYKTTASIAEKLIRHYPKKSYWVQLSAVYGMLERDNDQLGTLEAAYMMGGLRKEQQLVKLAYLYISSGVPYRAAKVLEKGIEDKLVKPTPKNLKLLSQSWQQSQEIRKAIPVLTEAAKMSKNGDFYGDLVALYLDVDDSKSAVNAGKQAFKKGGLKRPAAVHLNVGIAHTDLEQFDSAIKSFKEAEKDKRVRRMAAAWRKFAEREVARKAALDAG